MGDQINYRLATSDDARRISELSVARQEKYAFPDYSDERIVRMRRLSSAEATRRNIEAGDLYILAEARNTLVGAIHIRDKSEIVQLFVDTQWHRIGIDTELWQRGKTAALENGGSGTFILRSSKYAVEVYRPPWTMKLAITRWKVSPS